MSDLSGVYEECRGVRCTELHGEGRQGWFTLRLIGSNSLIAVDISDKERKHARRFGGFIFDRENYAQCRAHQLSKETLKGSFVPLPRGGKMYVLPWTAQGKDCDDPQSAENGMEW